MHASPHRQNSDFQLRYFLAGDCKTPDGAYCLLYNQKIDMETKLRHAEAQKRKREARIEKAWYTIQNSQLKHEVMEAEADKLEAEADVPVWELNVEGAQRELQTISVLMDEIRPRCQYVHLSILDQAEAAQREEWRLELQRRAENYLMTMQSIPADHFNTMRSHPDFDSHLVPHISEFILKLEAKKIDNKEMMLNLPKPLMVK